MLLPELLCFFEDCDIRITGECTEILLPGDTPNSRTKDRLIHPYQHMYQFLDGERAALRAHVSIRLIPKGSPSLVPFEVLDLWGFVEAERLVR